MIAARTIRDDPHFFYDRCENSEESEVAAEERGNPYHVNVRFVPMTMSELSIDEDYHLRNPVRNSLRNPLRNRNRVLKQFNGNADIDLHRVVDKLRMLLSSSLEATQADPSTNKITCEKIKNNGDNEHSGIIYNTAGSLT